MKLPSLKYTQSYVSNALKLFEKIDNSNCSTICFFFVVVTLKKEDYTNTLQRYKLAQGALYPHIVIPNNSATTTKSQASRDSLSSTASYWDQL